MNKYITVILYLTVVFLTTTNLFAQSVLGEWNSINPDDNKIESTVNVYLKNNLLYAKIIKISDPLKQGKLCTACKGKNKNKPILGMIILFGLKKDGDEWNGGKILDPKSGKIYKCYITLKDINTLKLRGYIGFSLLGRTEYWQRVNK